MTLKQLAGKLTESHCMESLETPGKLEVRANFRSKTAHLQAKPGENRIKKDVMLTQSKQKIQKKKQISTCFPQLKQQADSEENMH